MVLSKDEVSRLSYLFVSTLRRMGGLKNIGVVDEGGFLEKTLLKNRIKVQTDFMSQAVSKYDLKKVSTLLVYAINQDMLSELSDMFDDVMVIACLNRQFGYEEWRKALCDIGNVTTIHRSDSYQMMVVIK